MYKVSQSYKQKFRKNWLSNDLLKEWLVEIPSNPQRVHCSFCKCELNAKYYDLINHTKSKKHNRSVLLRTEHQHQPQPVINFSIEIVSFETAMLECRLALFMASHSKTVTTDHLVDTLKTAIMDSMTVSNLTMKEQKCSVIIKNVLSVHFVEDLVEDIGDGHFSLILDEVNDISVLNRLGIVIVYYSRERKKVVSTFLKIVEPEECDTYGIIKALKHAIWSKNLSLDKLIGIGTDNPNDLIENKVYKTLKKEIPSLILFRCVCGSIQSAISYASAECLPKHLEFLIAETYKWFSLPTSRQLVYADLYKTLNDCENPLKVNENLKARWLVNETAVGKIIGHWDELKMHFEIARNKENCYTSEVLYEMYKNDLNLAYLFFYHPILIEVQMINQLFESVTADKVKLLDELILLIQSIASKLILPTTRVNTISSDIKQFLNTKPYLGYRFEKKIEELRNGAKVTDYKETEMRENCRHFLLLLFNKLKQRLPLNLDILKNLSVLSVSKALGTLKGSIVHLMETMGYSEEVISATEIQWSKLHLINWNNKSNTDAFWAEVLQYEDASGGNPFKELSEFATKMLALPYSDAEVKRIFSCMKIAKLKVRNRTELKMQNALLTVKYGLSRQNKCCETYELPEDIIHSVMTLDWTNQSPYPSTSRFGINNQYLNN